MKKWICKNENCGKNCELSIDYQPIQCPRGLVWVPEWQEMEELNKGFAEKALREAQEKITGKSTALPKLTAEVFNRPDCPEWAKYAAVDSCGDAYYYNEKPHTNSRTWGDPVLCEFHYIGKFDASNWQNSLIERPARLPDWCKVGEWIYSAGGEHKYAKITSVRGDWIFTDVNGGYSANFINEGNVSQARLRPYYSEEMRELVGKLIYTAEGKVFLVMSYQPDTVFFGEVLHTAEGLIQPGYTFPDGSPCGVLEHLEDGAWVE